MSSLPVTTMFGREDLSDDGLLDAYADAKRVLREAAELRDRLEMELQRRAAERGAAAIMGQRWTCELKRNVSYDQTAFTPLKEILGPADLEACFTPAHEAITAVPDHWDTVRVKALARRYGAEALGIVERAQMPGTPRLELRERRTS